VLVSQRLDAFSGRNHLYRQWRVGSGEDVLIIGAARLDLLDLQLHRFWLRVALGLGH